MRTGAPRRIAMLTIAQIREGLARPGKSQKGLAAAMGVDTSTVSRLLAGKRPLRAHEIPVILGYLEAGSAAAGGGRCRAMPEIVQIGGDRFAMLPVYDAMVSAGPGAEAEETPPATRIAFRVDWLKRVARGNLGDLVVLTVDGDSMEPTLRQGDSVLVDMGQQRPGQKDGIYVIRTDGGLQAKRVAVNPTNGRVSVISDNKDLYPAFVDLSPAEIQVIGRVIWLGRQVGT
ncbi:LexA family transcriptional regulator [Rubritepida flocculans]|uniref:LexA family transcriptional regulator n=1 Tax=Rubritepida flocculans TaxID=182403 RepID=UPI00068717A8|nr:helix-turn-helix transcriptional regulator [Rubritepida flocculans]